MGRRLGLWLPTFATDLSRRRLRQGRGGTPPERVAGGAGRGRAAPILLTRTVGGRVLVAERCGVAAEAGIRPGMDLAHARSLLASGATPHVEAHRPDRNARALHDLACWALRISPTVAAWGADGVVCDLTGTARLYGEERRAARSAGRAVNRLGLAVRVAAASTWSCAMAVARFGERPLTIVAAGEERSALAALPASALAGDDPLLLEGFRELGIERAGEVMALPRRQLAARFGAGLVLRIDRMLGHADETIEPVHPPPPIMAELLFDGPSDRYESLEAAAKQTVEELAARLCSARRGVRHLEFLVLRPEGPHERMAIQLSHPSASARHLWTLLRRHVERVDMGRHFEGVRAVALRAVRLRDRQGVHPDLIDEEATGDPAALGELTDTLINRLGAERVVRCVARASHIPERAFAVRSVLQPPLGAGSVTRSPRPTVLLPRPEPAEVTALTPDGPVLEIGWRGKRERTCVCIGPERIGPEWWRWRGLTGGPRRADLPPPPPDRDYFAVQLVSGPWLWVCRQVGASRWFVHGQWA